MATGSEIFLTQQQHSELNSIAQSRALPAGYVFRAKLILLKDGLTKLTFLDRAGHERVALTSAEDSAALEMKDEKGRLGATMEAGVSKDGMSSTIAAGAPLIGPMAGPCVVMQASEVSTSLRICDKGGHQVWAAPSGRESIRK